MAPKSANFARKNRIATILCVHRHFPDFRKPSRNIVQIGAEFERKMADLFRTISDISVHKMVVQLLSVEQQGIIRERGVTPNGLMELPGRDGWHGTHGQRHRVVVVVLLLLLFPRHPLPASPGRI